MSKGTPGRTSPYLIKKKVPIIPPLFHENEFVTDFKKKTELFYSFFAKQCSLISNHNKLPCRLNYCSEKRLSTIKFSSNNVFDIIQQLDPNKHIIMISSAFRCCKFVENLFVDRWN